jgi:hypothetical protein
MRCEGPAIVRCPGFALYFLALGDATDFPESARDAWSFLPARIYFDELPRLPESSQVGASGMRAWRPKESRIVRAGAALAIGTPLIGPSESTVGTLEVVGRGGIERVAVGPEALERGVLVGRYPRCSGAHDRLDASLSRVHLLVIRLADRVYAIDTSSTNGTRDMGGTAVRIVELEEGTGLLLGLGGARVRWVPAAGGGCR